MTAPIVHLPLTPEGRHLLRLVLPFVRPDGTLPDGSSIYGTDFDEAAAEIERSECGEMDSREGGQ